MEDKNPNDKIEDKGVEKFDKDNTENIIESQTDQIKEIVNTNYSIQKTEITSSYDNTNKSFVLNFLNFFGDKSISGVNAFTSFYKKDKNTSNELIIKVFISLTALIFIVGFSVSYSNSSKILDAYSERKEILEDMIEINIGAHREPNMVNLNNFSEFLNNKNKIYSNYKVVNSKCVNQLITSTEKNFIINSDKDIILLTSLDNVNLLKNIEENTNKNFFKGFLENKKEIPEELNDFVNFIELSDKKSLLNIRKKLDSNTSFNINEFIEVESGILSREIAELNALKSNEETKLKNIDNIALISAKNNFITEFKNLNDSLKISDNLFKDENLKKSFLNLLYLYRSDATPKLHPEYWQFKNLNENETIIQIIARVKKKNDSKISIETNSLDKIKLIDFLELFNQEPQKLSDLQNDLTQPSTISLKDIKRYNENYNIDENLRYNNIMTAFSLAHMNLNNLGGLELNQKAEIVKKISDLKNQIDYRSNSKTSLGRYKQNKTYLFQKQFDLHSVTIKYLIDKAIYYMALYNTLILLILILTVVIAGCVFLIGTSGWKETNSQIKLISALTGVTLMLSNLILVTIQPKQNYNQYILKADNNELVQKNIINFFNNYESLTTKNVDSMLQINMNNLTKFTDILPTTDESNLSKDISSFGSLNN